MDSVSVAFELMQNELEIAVENLNSEGAKNFRLGRYAEAETLAGKGKAMGEFRRKVASLANEWVEQFAETSHEAGVSTEGNETARKILKHTKSAKTGLRVRFVDGVVISERTAAGTLVEALKKIGLERVSGLSLLVNGENLVSDQSSPKDYNEQRVGNFFVKTHSNTAQKKHHLERISEELGLGLEVDIL